MTYQNQGYQGYQGYGGAMDARSIQARIAQAQLQEGMSTTPIQSKWQGVARLANALMGGLTLRGMQGQDAAGLAAIKSGYTNLGNLYGSGGAGSPLAASDSGSWSPPGAGGGTLDDAAIAENAGIDGGLPKGPAPVAGPPQGTMAPNNAAGGAPPMTLPNGGGGAISNPQGTGGYSPGSALSLNGDPRVAALAAAINPGMAQPGGGLGLPPQGIQVASANPNFAPGGVSPPPFTAPASDKSPAGTDAGMQSIFADDGGPAAAKLGGAIAGPAPGGPMSLVENVESGGRNIPQSLSTADVNNNYGRGGGTPAQGYLQIIDPTWRAYAGKAGVDINQYPSAIDAPRAVQEQVASAIPVNQWGPATVRALRGTYGDFDTGQTLGQLQARFGGGSPQPDMHAMVAGPGAPSNMGNAAPSSEDPMVAGLKSIFGIGGPGNAAPTQSQPAQGTSPGSMNMGQILGDLAARAYDPYSSPEIRQANMQLLQAYQARMIPQFEVTTRPDGSMIAVNKMNPSQSVQIQGPMKTPQFVKGGPDMMGVEKDYIFHPDTGQYEVVNSNGSAGAPSAGGGFNPPGAAPAPPSAPAMQPPVAKPNIPPPNPSWQPQPGPNGPGGPVASAGAPPVAPAAPPVASGASPSPQWSPGQPISPDIDAKLQGLVTQYVGNDPKAQGVVYQYAKSLLQGNRAFVTGGTVAKSPPVEIAETIASQIDPDGMPQTRFDTIKQNADTSNPTSLGGQRMAAQTSVRHMGALAEASDLLGQQGQVSSSELGAKVQDWAARNLGANSGGLVNASQAYNAALVPVLAEVDKLYKGGQATDSEIDQMKANLSAEASPSARRAALTELSGLLSDKVDVLQKTWHMGVGDKFPDLPIIDQKGQAALGYIANWKSAPVTQQVPGAKPPVQAVPGAVTHVWSPDKGLQPVSP